MKIAIWYVRRCTVHTRINHCCCTLKTSFSAPGPIERGGLRTPYSTTVGTAGGEANKSTALSHVTDIAGQTYGLRIRSHDRDFAYKYILYVLVHVPTSHAPVAPPHSPSALRYTSNVQYVQATGAVQVTEAVSPHQK